MNNYIIYVHINKINQKIYIGQTRQSINRRFRHNGEGYQKCTRFYSAIQKYGWDNFEHIILFENLSLEEANEIEKYLIKKYDTTNPNFGYNINTGGNGFNAFSGEIISLKNKEKWENGQYDNIKNAVYCIELQTTFESALEAERQTGIDNSSIQKVCRNKIKYCGYSPQGQPLHWIFAKDKNEDIINQLKFKPETIKGVSIPVYCKELCKIFNSTKAVEEELHIDPSSIRKAIRGEVKSAGKHPITGVPLHWEERLDLINSKNKISQAIWDKLVN